MTVENTPARIGILGGTFNPIHRGHMDLAAYFFKKLELDRLLIIPAGTPPHKDAPMLARADDRLAMCRLAARGQPGYRVSDMEIARGGPSFTVDTLEELHSQDPQAQLFFLTGSDMFLTIQNWYRFDRLCTLATFCTAPRREHEWTKLCEHKRYLQNCGASVVVADKQVLDISSTQIRERIAAGRPVSDLVPHAVEEYLKQKHLYK